MRNVAGMDAMLARIAGVVISMGCVLMLECISMMSMEDRKSRVNTNDYAWLAYKDTFLEQMLECALRGRRPLRGGYTASLGAPVGRDKGCFRPTGGAMQSFRETEVYASRSDRPPRRRPVRQDHLFYRFPRSSCSRSMASNRALKFPLPKLRLPLRWMIS